MPKQHDPSVLIALLARGQAGDCSSATNAANSGKRLAETFTAPQARIAVAVVRGCIHLVAVKILQLRPTTWET